MGNFSKDPKIVLQEALEKGYGSVRFQQGKPVLDRELNLLADLATPQRLAEHHLGNGVPADSNGFLISDLDVDNDNFTIGAGRCLVGGYEITLTVNTTYKTQPYTENVSPLPEVGNVYLRVFQSEATGAQDSDLNNSGAGDVGFETAVREKTEWEVLVTTAVINTHDHFLLAEINTITPAVQDRRRTGLTVASIRDELALSRGSFSQLSGRLDVSLSADGTLKTDSVGNSQIVDNIINEAKFDISTRGKLVANGNNHDHIGGDGAIIKHSSLNKDDGTNPHGTTAGDLGALLASEYDFRQGSTATIVFTNSNVNGAQQTIVTNYRPKFMLVTGSVGGNLPDRFYGGTIAGYADLRGGIKQISSGLNIYRFSTIPYWSHYGITNEGSIGFCQLYDQTITPYKWVAISVSVANISNTGYTVTFYRSGNNPVDFFSIRLTILCLG